MNMCSICGFIWYQVCKIGVSKFFLKAVFHKIYLVYSWILALFLDQFGSRYTVWIFTRKEILNFSDICTNPSKWSNTLKQFVDCCCCRQVIWLCEAYSEPSQISKMELFAKIVEAGNVFCEQIYFKWTL